MLSTHRPNAGALLRPTTAITDPAPTQPADDKPDLPAACALLAQVFGHDLNWPAPAERDGSAHAPSLARERLHASGAPAQPALYDTAQPMMRKSGRTTAARRPPRASHGAPNDQPRCDPDACAANVGPHQRSPLWRHVLKEAETPGRRRWPGPVGARLLAQTPARYGEAALNADPGIAADWALPRPAANRVDMVDLTTLGRTNDLHHELYD